MESRGAKGAGVEIGEGTGMRARANAREARVRGRHEKSRSWRPRRGSTFYLSCSCITFLYPLL